MRAKKKWITAALSLLLAALAAFCFIFAYPALTRSDAAFPVGYKGVLRLWHIDGFEGGKGSRASFLQRAAKTFERKNEGLFVMITAHTPESAANALAEGRMPDMISFGGDCGFVADIALPLEKYDCAAASAGGETYAAPWCRGGYFLFSADGGFSGVTAENTVISEGKGAFAAAAAALEGLRGDFAVLPSVQAYTALIAGKYKYMLGTQRDVQRFRVREFSVQAKPLERFCDLWQYISVCTEDAGKYNACLDFIALLLSEEVQKGLASVGMLSPYFRIYGEEGGALAALEAVSPARTFPAFADESAREAFRDLAFSVLNGDENGAKKLENYLV